MSFFILKKFTFTALTFTFECILTKFRKKNKTGGKDVSIKKNNDEMMTTRSQAG